MASWETVELSRLSDHCFAENVARARATTQPRPQNSTTNQSSGSVEPGLVRPSPRIFPPSDHTIQDVSEAVSPSDDRSPLITSQVTESLGESILRRRTGKHRATIPWPLRRGPLLGLIAYLTALIIALELLRFLSDRNQGLVTAREDASYLWKYLPTASKYRRVRHE